MKEHRKILLIYLKKKQAQILKFHIFGRHILTLEWVSEWLLINTKWTIFQLPYLGLNNAQDFAQILYFVGVVCIINRNNVFHSFPDREITCPPCFFCLLLSTCKVKYFLNCLDTIPQNVIISDNCLPFFILYHYFLSSSTINCVNLRSDPEFKLIFTDAVPDFESITQHPDNKNIIWKRQ